MARRIITAKDKHQCIKCPTVIQKGEKFTFTSSLSSFGPECMKCYEKEKELFENRGNRGGMYGNR